MLVKFIDQLPECFAPTPCGITTDVGLDPLIINGFEEFLSLLDNQTFCLT